MALSCAYVTAPAAAAAMGLYLFGRNLSNDNGGGGGGMEAMAAAKEKKKDGSSAKVVPPKLAPQFDGLFCFETIVRR